MYISPIKVIFIWVELYFYFGTVLCYPTNYYQPQGDFLGVIQPDYLKKVQNIFELPDLSTTYSNTPFMSHFDSFLGWFSKPKKTEKQKNLIKEQLKVVTASESDNSDHNTGEMSPSKNDIPKKISNDANLQSDNDNTNIIQIGKTGGSEKNNQESNCTLVIESSCEEQRKLFEDIFKYPVSNSNLDNDIDIESTTDYESTTFDDIDISVRFPSAVVASLLG